MSMIGAADGAVSQRPPPRRRQAAPGLLVCPPKRRQAFIPGMPGILDPRLWRAKLFWEANGRAIRGRVQPYAGGVQRCRLGSVANQSRWHMAMARAPKIIWKSRRIKNPTPP